MQTTPHGSDLQEKTDQRNVPPGGSNGPAFFPGARQAGSGPSPDANVIGSRDGSGPRRPRPGGRAGVRQAVRDIRTAPPPPPDDPPADPAVAAPRRVVDDLAASTHAIGELMLEVARPTSPTPRPPSSSRSVRPDWRALEHGLAARRHTVSGDRRAPHGTVLQTSHPGCSCQARPDLTCHLTIGGVPPNGSVPGA